MTTFLRCPTQQHLLLIFAFLFSSVFPAQSQTLAVKCSAPIFNRTGCGDFPCFGTNSIVKLQDYTVTTNDNPRTTTICYDFTLEGGSANCHAENFTAYPLRGVSFVMDECCPTPRMQFLQDVSVGSNSDPSFFRLSNRDDCVEGSVAESYSSDCTRTRRQCISDPSKNNCVVLNVNNLKIDSTPSKKYCLTIAGSGYDDGNGKIAKSELGKAKICFERGMGDFTQQENYCQCVDVDFVRSTNICQVTPSPTTAPVPTLRPTNVPTTCSEDTVPPFHRKNCANIDCAVASVVLDNIEEYPNIQPPRTNFHYRFVFPKTTGNCNPGKSSIRGFSFIMDECCPVPKMEFMGFALVSSRGSITPFSRTQCVKGTEADAFSSSCTRTYRPCVSIPGKNDCVVLNVNNLDLPPGSNRMFTLTVFGSNYITRNRTIRKDLKGHAKFCVERGEKMNPSSPVNLCSCVRVPFLKSNVICETTWNPTAAPTNRPSIDPTKNPTNNPTPRPTFRPSDEPTSNPTGRQTLKPTAKPTFDPTIKPTLPPIIQPTNRPSDEPTIKPTSKPTFDPTSKPTVRPISEPTFNPTMKPTQCVNGFVDCNVLENIDNIKCKSRQICTTSICQSSPNRLDINTLISQKDLFKNPCDPRCTNILPQPKLILDQSELNSCQSKTKSSITVVTGKGQSRGILENSYYIFGKKSTKNDGNYVDQDSQYLILDGTDDGYPSMDSDFSVIVKFALDSGNTREGVYIPIISKEKSRKQGEHDWCIWVRINRRHKTMDILFSSDMNYEIMISATIHLRFDAMSVGVTYSSGILPRTQRSISLFANGRLLTSQQINQNPQIGQIRGGNIKIGRVSETWGAQFNCIHTSFEGVIFGFNMYSFSLSETEIFAIQTCEFQQEYISITKPHDDSFLNGTERCRSLGYELAVVKTQRNNWHAYEACWGIDPVDCFIQNQGQWGFINETRNDEKNCTVLLINGENKGKWVKRSCEKHEGIICGPTYDSKICNETKSPTIAPSMTPTRRPTGFEFIGNTTTTRKLKRTPTRAPTRNPTFLPTKSPTPSHCPPPNVCIMVGKQWVVKKKIEYDYMKWNNNGLIEKVAKKIDRIFVSQFCSETNQSIELTSASLPGNPNEIQYDKATNSIIFDGSVSAYLTHSSHLNQNSAFTFMIDFSIDDNAPTENMALLSQENGIDSTFGWSLWVRNMNEMTTFEFRYGKQIIQGSAQGSREKRMRIVGSYSCEGRMIELYLNSKRLELTKIGEGESSCESSVNVNIKVGGASAALNFKNCWGLFVGRIYAIEMWRGWMKEKIVKKCVPLSVGADAFAEEFNNMKTQKRSVSMLILCVVLVICVGVGLVCLGCVCARSRMRYGTIESESDVRRVLSAVNETTPLKSNSHEVRGGIGRQTTY